MVIERIKFRLIKCPECGHLLCWVNPRLPSYCPECGKLIFMKVKQSILVTDDEALLTLSGEMNIAQSPFNLVT